MGNMLLLLALRWAWNRRVDRLKRETVVAGAGFLAEISVFGLRAENHAIMA